MFLLRQTGARSLRNPRKISLYFFRLTLLLALFVFPVLLSGCDWFGSSPGNKVGDEQSTGLFGGSLDGHLAYVRQNNIWVLSGKTSRQITANAVDLQPSWSPDGQHLVFVRRGNSYSDIFSCDADGKNIKALTKNKGHGEENSKDYVDSANWAFHPTWSPDGQSLAYLSEMDLNNLHLYFMKASGGTSQRVDHETDGSGDLDQPNWSPDGTKIVLVTYVSGKPALGIFEVSKKHFSPLETGSLEAYDPAWSPDGKWLAFTGRENKNNDLYLIAVDGGEAVRLTTTGNARLPTWLADSQHLIYLQGKDDSFDLATLTVTYGQGGPTGAKDFNQLTKGYNIDPNSGLSWRK